MRLLPAIVISLGVAAFGHAAEIAPGAVVSADGRAAYLRVPAGALEARSVEQGGVLWRVAEDLRPLAARDGRLLCQRAAGEGRLELVVLDAASGRPLAATVFALPEGVSSPLDEVLGTRFDLRATADGARVLLVWRFERRPVRGAHFEEERGEDGDDEGEEDGERTAEGAVSVDLAAARATAAAVPARQRHALSAAVEARSRTGLLRERPLPMGALLVATSRTGAGLALERWTASGQPLAPIALPDGVVLQRSSADERHVLVSREVPGAPLDRAHEWTVIALDTGAVAGSLRTSVAAAAFEVAGGRVLLALEAWGHRAPSGWRDEPRRLEAFAATGAAAWTEALRDPAYHGPVAP
ncbi:MAG: hypothetical protein ABW221_24110 [Vicinamibacteria bacterium]